MFGKLKDKLKSWLGKSKEKEEKPEKETKEKVVKPKKEKTLPKKETQKKPFPTEEELKSQAEKINTEIPQTFNVGMQGFEADTEEIKKITTKESKEEKVTREQPTETTKPETTTEEPQLESALDIPIREEAIEEVIKSLDSQEKDLKKIDQAPEKPIEKKGFFSRLISKVKSTTLEKKHVDEIFEELEMILLENNVALAVVDKIKEDLHKDLVGIEVKKEKIQETIINSLKQSITDVLIEPEDLIKKIKSSLEPYTIIFFGINGSGKTTSVAKLASKLKENGISVVLAAADTFRAAAIQQLETHAKKLNVPIIKQDYGSDPTAVAFDAKQYAQKNKIQCVLIDTAGRMYTKENLIKQMEKIIRVIKPNLKIFVGESITGNDATEQAKRFNDAVGIDGIILSKADVDDKAGTILSVSYVTKAPIYYLGVGQKYEDLQDFKKETVLKNLGLD